MATTDGVNSASSSSSSSSSSSTDNGIDALSTSDFLQLMITELQNQDPMNPESNSEMMQEVGQIKQISSTDELTSTLNAVLLGQNLSNSSSLIGKNIDGLDANGNSVSGVVSQVTIATDGTAQLTVGSSTVSLNNVRDVTLPTVSEVSGQTQ